MKNIFVFALISSFLLFLGSSNSSLAQEFYDNHPTDHDTTYYISYNEQLHLRLYTVYKFNELIVNADEQGNENLTYTPNGNLNVGFGFNYKGLGINIGLNLPAINNDNDKFGETQKLDMRSYVYGRKYAFDLGLQFYKGFYISELNRDNPPNNTEPIELRGDMKIHTVGVSVLKIHNHEKFSFRAAFAQTEVQKKTAGSLIYGPYINFVRIKADSSLIPEYIRNEYLLSSNIVEGWYGSMGITAGYAQSLILFKRFFITAAAALGYGATFGHSYYETQKGKVNETAWKGGIKINSKVALGYNSEKTYVGGSFVLESYNITTSEKNMSLYWMGQYRFNIVRRFNWKVAPLDWVFDKKDRILKSGPYKKEKN
ncbi:DUF4421 family protein [Flammeovirga kamogawensis]|uniref:DUF4421 domain-containing protein n=1 Tax=Flammeovirga kamogawensis TaxID=373891 RepID=A0ABX8GWY6_9BACT|nr:DUF4421 family protein [Flammeovirga kamogawensis]MBB6461279.1 hypothetical protein [Flammeovirga kamogawensis]QWG07838.1 DUF4421 domain-containing protein [Flammeovirga kamogawensis]